MMASTQTATRFAHHRGRKSKSVSDTIDNRFRDMHREALGSIFLARCKSETLLNGRTDQSSLGQSVAAAVKSAANKDHKNYPQVTAFESRGGAAPVCAKSTRRVSRVMWLARGGVSDEWK
jgi:hypothetical protein